MIVLRLWFFYQNVLLIKYNIPYIKSLNNFIKSEHFYSRNYHIHIYTSNNYNCIQRFIKILNLNAYKKKILSSYFQYLYIL